MLKRSLLLIPARTELYQAKLGFYLLVASLGMFFAGSLITYVTIRYVPVADIARAQSAQDDSNANNDSLAANQIDSIPESDLASFRGRPSPYANRQTQLEPLVVPRKLLASTCLLIVVSVLLHLAVVRVSQERQQAFRRYLILAMIAATGFMAIQATGMADLIAGHQRYDDGRTKLFGIAFTLAFIHALHVLGGFVFLGLVVKQAFNTKYDHERHWSVDICAGYWHFLDVVWIAMLATFLIAN